MDVFLIPVAPDRYELYCEQPVTGEAPIEPESHGLVDRVRQWFGRFVRAAEQRERTGPACEEPQGWIGRMQDRAMAWVAERIAEQRLLWNLRGETSATAAHPADMTFEQVNALIRASLQADYERHRRWMYIDGLLFIVTFVALGPLFILIPGVANLPALFFGFRTVGHFLSMRGAFNGLRNVVWAGRSCPPLGELRQLAVEPPFAREARVREVAAELRLEHLPKFFDRVAIERYRV
jgi:hypothetical protein